jgi:predicted alpha/beta hydrolase
MPGAPSPRPVRSRSLTPENVLQAVRRGEARALGEGGVKATALSIPATDGVPLAASFYAPAVEVGSAAGTIVIASATGVRRHYYDGFARALAAEGFRVVTFDYRGIGGSRPASLRGYRASARQWGERDLEGVLAWTGERFRGDRRLLVAHSIGGQLLGLAPSAATLDGALFVGSQIGYWGLFEVPWKWLFAFVMHVAMPGLVRALGYFPASRLRAGEDLPAGVALEWAQWCRDPEYYFAHGVPRDGFDRLRLPLLAVTISDDAIAPRRASEALVSHYRNAAREERLVRPADVGLPRIGHFGWFRAATGDRLWPPAIAWLRGVAAGAPAATAPVSQP